MLLVCSIPPLRQALWLLKLVHWLYPQDDNIILQRELKGINANIQSIANQAIERKQITQKLLKKFDTLCGIRDTSTNDAANAIVSSFISIGHLVQGTLLITHCRRANTHICFASTFNMIQHGDWTRTQRVIDADWLGAASRCHCVYKWERSSIQRPL